MTSVKGLSEALNSFSQNQNNQHNASEEGGGGGGGGKARGSRTSSPLSPGNGHLENHFPGGPAVPYDKVTPVPPFPGAEIGPQGICYKDIADVKVVSIRTLSRCIETIKYVSAGRLKALPNSFTHMFKKKRNT